MTVCELVSMLSAYPAETRVTLLDPDKLWLLPIEITYLPAQGSAREVDFVAITADRASDEIEGLVSRGSSLVPSPPIGRTAVTPTHPADGDRS
jgi:hypothetical protein